MCNVMCNNGFVMQTQNYERINIIIPRATAAKLRKTIPRGQRSNFVKEAIEKQLTEEGKDMYEELLRIRKKGPRVSMEEVVRWVREDR